MNKHIAGVIIGSAAVTALLVAGGAFAQTTAAPGGQGGYGNWKGGSSGQAAGMHQMQPGVFGTVASVSGTTLTVTSKVPQFRGKGMASSTPPAQMQSTTYTVDASNATVMKDNATSTLSAIAVGDSVMVQGAVSGTSVTATTIRDLPAQAGGMPMQRPTAPQIQGNGEPVVGGSISAISGASLTLTNKSNVTYTVDATNATIEKGNATSSLSSVAIGDNVLVQGTVNGNAVTASLVIDQGVAKTSASGAGGMMPMKGIMGGVFGAIGGFLQHIFGFF